MNIHCGCVSVHWCIFIVGVQEEETDEETDDDDDTDVSLIAFKEDALLTSTYRDMTTHLKSARLDAVVAAGLGLPRKYVFMTLLLVKCLLYTNISH